MGRICISKDGPVSATAMLQQQAANIRDQLRQQFCLVDRHEPHRHLRNRAFSLINSMCKYTWAEFEARFQMIFLRRNAHVGATVSQPLNAPDATLTDFRWTLWIETLLSEWPIIFIDSETVGTEKHGLTHIQKHPSMAVRRFFSKLPPYNDPSFEGSGNVARCVSIIGWPDHRLEVDFAQLGGMPQALLEQVFDNPLVIKVICGGYSTEMPALARVAGLANQHSRNRCSIQNDFLEVAGAQNLAKSAFCHGEPLTFPSVIDASLRAACYGRTAGLWLEQQLMNTEYFDCATALGILRQVSCRESTGGHGVGELFHLLTGRHIETKSARQGAKLGRTAPNGRHYIPSPFASSNFDPTVWAYIFGVDTSGNFCMNRDDWDYVNADAAAARAIFVAATLLLDNAVGQYTASDDHPEHNIITNFQKYLQQEFNRPLPQKTLERLAMLSADEQSDHCPLCIVCKVPDCQASQFSLEILTEDIDALMPKKPEKDVATLFSCTTATAASDDQWSLHHLSTVKQEIGVMEDMDVVFVENGDVTAPTCCVSVSKAETDQWSQSISFRASSQVLDRSIKNEEDLVFVGQSVDVSDDLQSSEGDEDDGHAEIPNAYSDTESAPEKFKHSRGLPKDLIICVENTIRKVVCQPDTSTGTVYMNRVRKSKFPLRTHMGFVRMSDELFKHFDMWKRCWKRLFQRICLISQKPCDLDALPHVALAFLNEFEWLVNTAQVHRDLIHSDLIALHKRLHMYVAREVEYNPRWKTVEWQRQKVLAKKNGTTGRKPAPERKPALAPIGYDTALFNTNNFRSIRSAKDPIVCAAEPFRKRPREAAAAGSSSQQNGSTMFYKRKVL